MPLHTTPSSERSRDELSIRPEFAQPGELDSVPRFRLAKQTLPPQTAYQLVHDELLLDGNSRLRPRHVRRDVDGATGTHVDGRVPGQEHRRPRRVAADRGARAALRGD